MKSREIGTSASAEPATAVVTGCSSGIGLAVAKGLLEKEFRVAGVSRRDPSLEHEGFLHLAADLSDMHEVSELGQRLVPFKPAAVVLCAGAGRFGSLEEHSPGQIQDLLELNLLSPILLLRELLPSMKASGAGKIVLIGSESAVRGGAFGSVYSAAKFGLRGFSQSLRHECSRAGVSVTLINPGMVRTPFFDDLGFEPGDSVEQALLAEDVADAVLLAVEARAGAVIDEIDMAPLKRVVRKKSSGKRGDEDRSSADKPKSRMDQRT